MAKGLNKNDKKHVARATEASVKPDPAVVFPMSENAEQRKPGLLDSDKDHQKPSEPCQKSLIKNIVKYLAYSKPAKRASSKTA